MKEMSERKFTSMNVRDECENLNIESERKKF